ncbi:MAG: NAD(P)/FAD-dependent oxidoreductase [Planctomycetota bacterium]
MPSERPSPITSNPAHANDTAIIGAGAAGLFAAISAGRSKLATTEGTVRAFDGAKKLGAKILIAGGGRCNVTHDVVRPVDYASGPDSSRNVIKKVLKAFSVEDTVAFFQARGVTLKREDTGKLFPTTDQARTVLHALLDAARDAGVALHTQHRVTGITRHHTDDQTPSFTVHTSQGDFPADRVILCTGGLALPSTGSDGFGYELARGLGHTVTPTWPALVPLVLPEGHWLTDLKGIALDAELTLAQASGKAVHRQAGPMLLTHFGLSGPAPMDISRHFSSHYNDPNALRLSANLLPPHNFDSLDAELREQAQAHPRRTVLQAVQAHFPERFAYALLEHAVGLDATTRLAQLPKDARRRLVHQLTALPLPVVADRGYRYAEVTAGGVPLSEVTWSTMASKACPGLHLAGEILDVDGRIGGYNFQWAWATGHLAGHAASAVRTGGSCSPA